MTPNADRAETPLGYGRAGAETELAALRLLAVTAVVASFFVALGGAPLFDLDEGAFSAATLEMLQRGDLISPYLAGAPRFDKPVLIHWLQAAGITLLGVNEWGFRLPSALAAAAWVWLTYRFVRRRVDSYAAVAAAIVLATIPSVEIIARAATADAVLNLCIAATLFHAYDYLADGRRRDLYIAAAACAAGVLTKGPVAIVVPAAVTLLYCLVRRDWRTWLRAFADWRAALLFLALAAPWYVAQYVQQGDAFIDSFFLRHNLQRFREPAFGHGAPFWFYVPVLLAGTLPFTVPLFRVFARGGRLFRSDLGAFLALWFLFVFVLFTVSSSKLPHYILYGMTGLVVLMALELEGVRSRFALLPALLAFALLAALPLLLEAALPYVTNPYARESLTGVARHLDATYLAYFAIAALLTLVWMVRPFVRPATALLGAAVIQAFGFAVFVIPAAGDVQQGPVVEAARFAAARDLDVVMSGVNVPSFMVYRGAVVERREPRACDVVLTRASGLASLAPHEVLFRRGAIALVRMACDKP